MSDYTLKNLKSLDNVAAGRDYDIDARFARGEIEFEHLGVSYFRYGPGVRPPYGHHHDRPEGGDGELVNDFWTD